MPLVIVIRFGVVEEVIKCTKSNCEQTFEDKVIEETEPSRPGHTELEIAFEDGYYYTNDAQDCSVCLTWI
jgi:hypothetical protein